MPISKRDADRMTELLERFDRLPLETATPSEIDDVLFEMRAMRWQFATWAYGRKQNVAATLFPKAKVMRTASSYSRITPLHATQIQSEYEAWQDWAVLVECLERCIETIDTEFDRRGGWTRYSPVVTKKAKSGHLHRGTWCSGGTFRPTTQILMVTEASGMDDSDVVGRFGETACTLCFKEAPVA